MWGGGGYWCLLGGGLAGGFRVSFLWDYGWPGSVLGGYGAGDGTVPGFCLVLYLSYCFFEGRVSFGDAAQASCVVACGLDLNVSGVLVLCFHYFSFL